MGKWINQTSNTCNGLVVIFPSLFTEEFLQTIFLFVFSHLLKCRTSQKYLILESSSENKERNITSKPVVSA